MHPERIKFELRMRGYTQSRLADELGVAQSSVAQTISGYIKSRRIQQRIAEIIESSPERIWPNQIVLRRSQDQINAARASAKVA